MKPGSTPVNKSNVLELQIDFGDIFQSKQVAPQSGGADVGTQAGNVTHGPPTVAASMKRRRLRGRVTMASNDTQNPLPASQQPRPELNKPCGGCCRGHAFRS